MQKSCGTCRFMVKEDSGYSNWTVMDTYCHCLKGLNPNESPEDSPYSEEEKERWNKFASFADTCLSYQFGNPAWLDVYLENLDYPYNDNPVEKFMQYCDAGDIEVATLLKSYVLKN